MAIGSGMNGQVLVAKEVTAGVPVVAGMSGIPLAGKDSLQTKRPPVESDGVIAGRRFLDAGMWNGGNYKVGGDLPTELYNKGLGTLLTAMWGTVGSTTGPVSSLYTHTWPSIGEPKPTTIQKGVTATNGVVYPFTFAGSMCESWEFGCKAGEIVTLGTSWTFMHEHGWRTVADGVTTSGSPTVTSATAAFIQDDVGTPISGTGIPANTYIGIVNSATSVGLSSSPFVNTPVNASATGSSIAFVIGIALATATYPSNLAPFKFVHGSITFAGTAQKVKQLTIAGKNGLDPDRLFIGSPWPDQALEADLHEVTGQLDVEFTSRTMYDRFLSKGMFALVIRFANFLGESVTFTMNVRLDGDPPLLQGRGIVQQQLPYKCVGTTDAAAFSAVVVSTDVTP
jgi:hypothetical protein